MKSSEKPPAKGPEKPPLKSKKSSAQAKQAQTPAKIKKSPKKDTLAEASFIGSYVKPAEMEGGLPEICFLGRSNAGKSSLIASLFHNPSIVKVSKKPGSTITLNQFVWKEIHIVDLPGFGYARTSHAQKEKLSQLIYRYLSERKECNLGFLLLDCNRGLQAEEEYIIKTFYEAKKPLVLLLTKVDRLNQKEMAALKKRWGLGKELPPGSKLKVVLPVTARNRKFHLPIFRLIEEAAKTR